MKISEKTLRKLLDKHNVTDEEVLQCFLNREGSFLIDDREDHTTNPPTFWFVAETDKRRMLKVVFVGYPDGTMEIKTAYPANQTELRIYNSKR